MNKTKIALLQFSSLATQEESMAEIDNILANQLADDTHILLFPEDFIYLGSASGPSKKQEDYQRITNWLSDHAKKYKLWIIAGTVPAYNAEADKFYARSLVFNPQGLIVDYYDKIHLFDAIISDTKKVFKESARYLPGAQIKNIALNDNTKINLGLTVCYDLRFPELYRNLVTRGANLLLVPSAFTYHTGKAHWKILLQARAIENQCYLLAANQSGININTGRHSWGHSLIIDPYGEILACADEKIGIIDAIFDIEKLNEVRNNMPCLTHRRIHLQ